MTSKNPAVAAELREPTTRENKVLQKDLDARRRACLNGDQTHLQLGTWRDLDDAEVGFVGHPRDLHGSVCTCCPKQQGAVA